MSKNIIKITVTFNIYESLLFIHTRGNFNFFYCCLYNFFFFFLYLLTIGLRSVEPTLHDLASHAFCCWIHIPPQLRETSQLLSTCDGEPYGRRECGICICVPLLLIQSKQAFYFCLSPMTGMRKRPTDDLGSIPQPVSQLFWLWVRYNMHWDSSPHKLGFV